MILIFKNKTDVKNENKIKAITLCLIVLLVIYKHLSSNFLSDNMEVEILVNIVILCVVGVLCIVVVTIK
jgi:hypothetical protein